MATTAKTMSISKELCDVIMLGCRCAYTLFVWRYSSPVGESVIVQAIVVTSYEYTSERI